MNKAQEFCKEILELSLKYNLPVFAITDGASITHNRNCEAIKYHRDCQIIWENQHNIDPYEDWNKK